MLCVFLLPAFTHLGHQCQDLLSPCDKMHVCTDYTSGYTLIQKSFGEMESEPMLTPGEKSPLSEKFSPEDWIQDAASSKTASPTHNQWGLNPRRCIKQDSEPNTQPMRTESTTLHQAGQRAQHTTNEDWIHDTASSKTASPTHNQWGLNPRRCIKQDSEPNTRPRSFLHIQIHCHTRWMDSWPARHMSQCHHQSATVPHQILCGEDGMWSLFCCLSLDVMK